MSCGNQGAPTRIFSRPLFDAVKDNCDVARVLKTERGDFAIGSKNVGADEASDRCRRSWAASSSRSNVGASLNRLSQSVPFGFGVINAGSASRVSSGHKSSKRKWSNVRMCVKRRWSSILDRTHVLQTGPNAA
jgi:hypothetical protein